MGEFVVQMEGTGSNAVLLVHGENEDSRNMQGYATLSQVQSQTVTIIWQAGS